MRSRRTRKQQKLPRKQKSNMKKRTVILSAVLAVIILALCIVGITQCSKPPEYEEIKARFIELVEASYDINKVLFGEGLPTDERVYDPWNEMETYERKNADGTPLLSQSGKPLYGYYCMFEEDILAYRDGATAATVFLKLEEQARDGELPVYVSEDGERYYYSCDYAPEEGIRYYSESDPEDYDYVSVDSKYISIDAIKAEAEKIYSKDYLESSVYESLFTGAVSADEDSNLVALSARYIEYADAESGDSTPVLMKSNTYKPLVRETRIFDFSTARVVRPGSKKLVNIELETYLESAPSERLTVRVTMALVDGVWYLDSPTY